MVGLEGVQEVAMEVAHMEAVAAVVDPVAHVLCLIFVQMTTVSGNLLEYRSFTILVSPIIGHQIQISWPR
jgi:hypothetical protein